MQGRALPARGVCGSGNASGRIWNPPLRVGVGVLDDPRKLPLPQSSLQASNVCPYLHPRLLAPRRKLHHFYYLLFFIYYFLFII